MREAFDHCPAGWIRQSRKCCTKIIHNQMVVDNRSMSTANFALRGFCPNVLTLKAVLMMLDLPGPQRRMANRQCAHRHRINTDMSACRKRSSRLPPILGGLRRNGSNALVRDVRLRSCKKFNFLPAWNRVFRQEIRLTPIKLHSQKLAEMRCINDSGGHSRSPASSTGTQ